ncbi:MAG: hypothetical protein HOM25_08765 [Rhodospirillaceae bacterium]|jgi:hypothetical protein|nr:hypothetical protein [Rhodospirillaceae bacterium]
MYLIDVKTLPPPLLAMLENLSINPDSAEKAAPGMLPCMGEVCDECPLYDECFADLESVEDQLHACPNHNQLETLASL